MTSVCKKWYSIERLLFIIGGLLLLVNAVYYNVYKSGPAWIGYALLGIAALAYQIRIKEK